MSAAPDPGTVAVVDCGPGDRDRLSRLEGALPTRVMEGAPSGPDELVERAAGATVLVTLYTYTKVPEEAIARLPELRLIVTRTAGYSHIDVDAAVRHGVTVAAVPTGPTVAVAEYTIAAILAMERRLFDAVSSTRAGEWEFTGFRGRDLSGRTLGILGLGGIGSRVAELATGLGMRVIGWSRSRKGIPGVEEVDLNTALEGADVVSVNVALTPETEGLLDAEKLRRMRPGASLVNTARGEVVDLDAVCELLRSEHLGAACLDVVAGEPVSGERLAELAEVPNLYLTPHISWHTEDTLRRQYEGLTDKVIAFCDGKPIDAVVTADAGT